MKLIRCYIENFGGLHQYQLDLSPNLTTLKEPNGFGKSTLAAFIRTMFYGMPRSYKSLEKNDRKRYQPWQGGPYGGWIEFEHEAVLYRVERSFGLSAKEDSFKLYTLHPFAPSTRFTENLGEEIFGLGAESFERTSYLPQLHSGNDFVNAEIQAQLTNLVENTDDMGDFDTAVQTLKSQRSKYLPYRGKGGTIGHSSERLTELQAELINSEQSRRELADTQNMLEIAEQNYSAKQQELQSVRNLITDSYGIVSRNALAEQYQTLQAQRDSLHMQQTRLRRNYPAGIPDASELAALSHAVTVREQANVWTLYPGEQQQLEQLEHLFESGVPTDEEINTLEMGLHTLNTLEADIQNRSEALMELHPDEKRIAPNVFFVLTALFALGGIALFYYEMPIYCFAATANACVCFVLATITGLIKGRRNLMLDKRRSAIKTIRKSADSLQDKLKKALGLYFVDGYDLRTALSELKAYRTTYIQLLDKDKMLHTQRIEHQSDADVIINAVLTRYGLSQAFGSREGIAQLQRIQEQMSALDTLFAHAETRLSQFEHTYGKPKIHTLDQTTEELKTKETQLIAELNDLQKTLSQLRQKVVLLQSETDRYMTIEDEMSKLREKQSADLAKVKALDKTLEHLIAARQSLSGKFIQPLKKRFTEYLTQFMRINTENIHLDTQFNITMEQFGAQRELGYFSVGQVDLIALCLRFALVDVLYGNSTPLLILDDPFVNLDDDNLQAALALLEQISQTHQILYLTCHDSRTN